MIDTPETTRWQRRIYRLLCSMVFVILLAAAATVLICLFSFSAWMLR